MFHNHAYLLFHVRLAFAILKGGGFLQREGTLFIKEDVLILSMSKPATNLTSLACPGNPIGPKV